MITIDGLHAQAVLCHHVNQLLADFDVEDVRYDLFDIITHQEYQQVIEHQSDVDRIEHLMFFLSVEPTKIEQFIDAISGKYQWIAKKMRTTKFSPDEMREIHDKIEILQEQIGQFSDNNVHRRKYMFAIHQRLLKLQPKQCIMLTGHLGIGKQWLAIDACSNYAVMRAMGAKIYYINLSKCNTKETILERMLQLYSNVVTDQRLPNSYDDNISIKIIELKNILNKHFRLFQNSLLILGDVQSVETLQAFRLECKIMLTARDKSFQKEWPKNKRFEIEIDDGFTHEESCDFFTRVLDNRQLPNDANEIHELCAGHPFIISLIGHNLAEYRSSGCWNKWVCMLKSKATMQYGPIRAVIEQSLCDLPDVEKILFQSLVIFGDNVRIPLSLLQLYWNKTAAEVEQIVEKFDRLYIVCIDKTSPRISCSLQYLYCSYLSYDVKPDIQIKMHRELIESYKIVNAIENRDEPNLLLPNDGYLYFFIAHHLYQAKMFDVLQTLYLDFGFLEQKLRATGLPNTIGDLESYRKSIIGTDPYRKNLLNSLRAFLPNVEEMLKKSEDTCLLQYALMRDGYLQLEAIRQAANFPKRLFFDGSDHVQLRQILPLQGRPIFSRFCNAYSTLIASDDNVIRLVDISPGYTVHPTIFKGHYSTVCDIKVLTSKFFISLDKSGICHVWSMENIEMIRSRSNSTSNVPASNVTSQNAVGIRQNRAESFDQRLNKPKFSYQTIPDRNTDYRIRCMTLIYRNNDDTSNTHDNHNTLRSVVFGTDTGQIRIYDWDNDKLFYVHHQFLKNTSIHSIVAISYSFLVVLTTRGRLVLVVTKSIATKELDILPDTTDQVIGIHVVSETTDPDRVLLVVFANKIIRVAFHLNDKEDTITSNAHPEIYPSPNSHRITCSALTDDREDLILGTEKGVVVFHVSNQQVVVHHNVSDYITFADILSLPDSRKYLLVCGTKLGTFCYVYALNNETPNNRVEKPRLLGGSMFAVTEFEGGELAMAAIDSKGVINRMYSDDSFKKSERIQCGNESSPINAFATFGQRVIVGCSDGCVYNNFKQKLIDLQSPVTYLRCFSDEFIVAGTNYSYWISAWDVREPSASIVATYQIGVKKNFLMVVKEDASFDIWDNYRNKIQTDHWPGNEFASCDFQNNVFVMASPKKMKFWMIQYADDVCQLVHYPNSSDTRFSQTSPAACVRLSMDHQMCAIGFDDGSLHLYRLTAGYCHLVHTLQSHRSRINALHFSPWSSDDRRPVILASLAEQLCIWNVTYAENNPNVAPTPLHRFSDRSPGTPDAEFRTIDDVDSVLSPWMHKAGPTVKPALLSCYKFVGNSAKLLFTNAEFSQFFTIDDVGAIYFLTIRKSEPEISVPDSPMRNLQIDSNDVFTFESKYYNRQIDLSSGFHKDAYIMLQDMVQPERVIDKHRDSSDECSDSEASGYDVIERYND